MAEADHNIAAPGKLCTTTQNIKMITPYDSHHGLVARHSQRITSPKSS